MRIRWTSGIPGCEYEYWDGKLGMWKPISKHRLKDLFGEKTVLHFNPIELGS